VQLVTHTERGANQPRHLAQTNVHSPSRADRVVRLRSPIISQALAALASASNAAMAMTRRNPSTKADATAPRIEARTSGLASDGTSIAASGALRIDHRDDLRRQAGGRQTLTQVGIEGPRHHYPETGDGEAGHGGNGVSRWKQRRSHPSPPIA
jgi:hypothetical protein